jgi:2-(1,2-epoxy-1,2-dihydrophenyl)acetyl-CoA isomerase
MTEPVVLTSAAGGVCTITMNRPKALNALNRELTLALREAVFKAEQDKAVRCVVIKGGEHFMAGGDLKWFHDNLGKYAAAEVKVTFEGFIQEVHAMIIALRRMPKPVLASVSGAAAGFGLSLVMACDLAIAADTSYYTLAYSAIGASPDGGSTFALPRLVGLKKAAEIALLAERFDAATAERLGLINKVVPAAELEAATREWAKRLAAGPTFAIGMSKRLLNRSLQSDMDTCFAEEAFTQALTANSEDMREGIRSFMEKRPPAFKGR